MHAPENTLESFRQAVELGVDAIEFDVHLTADGQPVVVHDRSVNRTTSGTGAVSSMTASALAALDAGARFSPDGGRTFPWRERGIRVPLLRDVIEQFPYTPLLIEIKTIAAAAPTRRVIEEMGAASRVVVAAGDVNAVAPFAGSRIATAAAMAQIQRLIAPVLLRRRATELPYGTLCLPRFHRGVPLPLRAIASYARVARVPVHVWTVNDASVAPVLWQAGIRGIISDDPGAMLRARAMFGDG
jgi:glycerophosphoryl diester phosphodiesterase